MKKYVIPLLALIICSCNNKGERELEEQQQYRDSLLFELDALKVENDSLLIEKQQLQLRDALPKDSVASVLRERTDLIPMEAVLGGTMRFGNIEVIDNGLIIADYNDGHVGGSSIFQYEKTSDSLSFQLLYQLKD